VERSGVVCLFVVGLYMLNGATGSGMHSGHVAYSYSLSSNTRILVMSTVVHCWACVCGRRVGSSHGTCLSRFSGASLRGGRIVVAKGAVGRQR
jgi:hypothetical protein